MKRTQTFALVAVLLSAPAAADVLDVDPTVGPYLSIFDAVQAASDGDTIRVATGSYGFFGVFDKALTIVRRDLTSVVDVVGLARVQGLARDRTVVLDGLNLTAGLLVYGNEGHVQLQSLNVTGWAGPGRDCCAEIELCADVDVVDCFFDANEQGSSPRAAWDGLEIDSSGSCTLAGCTAMGRDCTSSLFGAGCDGGHGIRVMASVDVLVSGGVFFGGDGCYGDTDCYDCTTYASGCFGFDVCYECRTGYGGNGVNVGFGQTNLVVVRDAGGSGGQSIGDPQEPACWYFNQEPLIGGNLPAFIHDQTGGRRELRAASVWRQGETRDLTVIGRPSERVFLDVLSASSVSGAGVLPAGGVAVHARRPLRLIGRIPASGSLVTGFTAPSLGVFEHETVHLKATLIQPGAREQTNWRSLAVLGDGF